MSTGRVSKWNAPGLSPVQRWSQSLVHEGRASFAGPTGLGEESYAGSRTRAKRDELSHVRTCTRDPWELLQLEMTCRRESQAMQCTWEKGRGERGGNDNSRDY